MKNQRILLVDDYPILLEGTRSLLGEVDGFEVSAVANYAENAILLLEKQPFDILVTDYEMGGMKGTELVQVAKKLQNQIRIIVLSMHDQPYVVKDLLKLGVDGYVLKSDTYESMTEALKSVSRKPVVQRTFRPMVGRDDRKIHIGTRKTQTHALLKLTHRDVIDPIKYLLIRI